MRTLLQLTLLCAFVMQQVVSEENDEDNGCGLVPLHMRDGLIVTSPNFPHPYPHNLNCTYFIHVGRNNSVILKFLAFDLELPLDDGNCTHDWLTIECNETDDENLDFGMRLCGTDLPWSSLRFSNCPVVNLTFFADSSVNGGGFSIEFTVFDDVNFANVNLDIDCGTTVFTSSLGSISLPKNSAEYPARVNCTFTISANRASRIWLGFKALQMPQLLNSFSDCNNEKIMIGCVSGRERELNPNTSNTYCSPHFSHSPSPPNEISFPNCTMVKISMQSSHYNYRAAYGIIPFTVHTLGVDCGTTAFTGSRGIIKSPSFPQSYSNRLDCVYTIDVDRTKNITLDFISFHLEGTSNYPMMDNCDYDWLKIRCLSYGFVRTEPSQEYKHCGEMTRSITIDFSSCDYLTLNFVSDSSDSYEGFQILYIITSSAKDTTSTPDAQDDRCGNTSFSDPECGNISFNGPNGFISSPQFQLLQKHHLNCLYSITGGQMTTISLAFLTFNIEGTSNTPFIDSCEDDWLTVSCLSDHSIEANISSSRRYCGIKTTPPKFTFRSCDVVVLNFQGNSIVFGGRFDVRYTVVDTESLCGLPVYGPPSGVFSFPLNTANYVDSFDCNYIINATERSSISLRIWSISHQSSVERNCQRDWLLFTCISGQTQLDHRVNHRSCEHHNSITQITFPSCATTQVDFHRDSEDTGKTFRIEYTISAHDESFVDTQMSSSAQTGHLVGISLAVILLVTGAFCLGAFLILRLHRKKVRSQRLLHQANEEESHITLELKDDSSTAGSSQR